MAGKLEQLSVDKDGNIFKVEAGVKGGNLLDKNKNSRPSWRQSELDVAKDYPNYAEQKSFLNGQDVPYGTKGSIRPDFYKTSKSIDVKNYNLEKETGKINSVRNIEEQYNKRIYHLPSGTKQTILIDIRGQKISQQNLSIVYNEIMCCTNNGVTVIFKSN